MSGRKSPRRRAREFVVQDLYGFLAKGEEAASILQKPKALTLWLEKFLAQSDPEELIEAIKAKDNLRKYLQIETSKLNIGNDFVVDRIVQILISSASSVGSVSTGRSQDTDSKSPPLNDRIFEVLLATAKAITDQYAAAIEECLRNEGELALMIVPYLSRPWGEVSPIERCILLLGACELKLHPETPYRVIINEAIELAKTFGGTDGHKFVNGVLDKLAGVLRPGEAKPR